MPRVAKNTNDNNEKKDTKIKKSTKVPLNNSEKKVTKSKKSVVESVVTENKKLNSKTKKSSVATTPKTKKSTTSTTKAKKVTKSTNDTKKKTTTSVRKTKKTTKLITSEHYDLPNTYNKTFISLLAQSPKILFVFWEISETDRFNYLEKYGSHFFENTRPVLIVNNKTKNTSFEIEINDFASHWYIEVENSDCEFEVQLGRRPCFGLTINDYIFVANSNSLISPNDHILLERLPDKFRFLNLKTHKISEIDRNRFCFSKIYNIYEFYKELYKDELQDNPSSFQYKK